MTCDEELMYYHPFMLTTPSNDRLLDTCRALTDVWFDGLERQRALHDAAVKAFYSAQEGNARTLSEFTHGAEFAAHFLACVVSEPLKLLTMAARVYETAADTHRRAVAVLEQHAQSRSEGSLSDADSKEHALASRQPIPRQQQVMA
jgi:hypothetical protein